MAHRGGRACGVRLPVEKSGRDRGGQLLELEKEMGMGMGSGMVGGLLVEMGEEGPRGWGRLGRRS